MDRALSCLLIALACLMIRPDQALAARDCLKCWRDVCVDGSFSADNSFSDCCGCIASAVIDCIPTASSAHGSQECCTMAETNLLSVFSSGNESNGTYDMESFVFNSPEQLMPIEIDGTLSQGTYVVPSFRFECSGCIQEVQVQALIPQYHEGTSVSMELMTLTHLDPPPDSQDDQDGLYRLNHIVLVTTRNVMEEQEAKNQLTITFSLSASNQSLCFEHNDELGFSFGANLQLLLVDHDGQQVNELGSSTSATCPNLNDFYKTTATTSGVPLAAVLIGPPPTPSAVVISSTPSTDSPSSGYSVRMMTSVTVDGVSVGGVPTSPASIAISTPTSQVSPPTCKYCSNFTSFSTHTVSSQHEQSVPLQTIIIGVVGGAVVLAFLVFVVLLAVCIIQRQRHHDKDKVDGNGKKITRVLSRNMERRLHSQAELLPVGESVNPFYDYPHTAVHQYELEMPSDSQNNPLSLFSTGNYTTMQPVGSAHDGSSTPVANVSHTVRSIYDEELASEQVAPVNGIPQRARPQVQDTPFYYTLEQPGQINGKMVVEVGYDAPVELLPKHTNREEIVNPIYNEIKSGPQQRQQMVDPATGHQMVDPATGHPYHVLEESAQDTTRGSEVEAVEECGLYVPTAEERRRISDHHNTTELSAGDLENWIKKSRLESTKKRRFFESTSTYWNPPSDADNLYNTLAKRKYREILSDRIQIVKYIGHGQFGTVNLAVWTQEYVEPMEVAVKVCRAGANEAIKTKFLKEAAIMGQFHHPNVVKLYGVVTMSEQPKIVIELMRNGDLLTYMKKNYEPGKMPPPSPLRLLSFSRQIATGMSYLSNKAFVHRDLAARNVLLNELHQCKIGDFGMARDLEDSEYYIMSRKGPMPLKWTAPEALNYRKYSTFSDCYSYGMVLYEIWSVGREPLSGISLKEVPDLVSKGFCQAPPPGCPRTIYELMVKLWNPEKRKRPPFPAIVDYLQQPDEKLLAWSTEDRAVSSQAAVLGAPLDEGKTLYLGLQNAYQSSWC